MKVHLNRGLFIVAALLWPTVSFCAEDEATPPMPPPADKKVDFERDIKPIFQDRCYRCHGEQKQESSLRLDT